MLLDLLWIVLGPARAAGRLWLWTVTAPVRGLWAFGSSLWWTHKTTPSSMTDGRWYGPRYNADGSIMLYDDGLVIRPGSTGAEIPSRLWVHLAGETSEREEEQFDPMQKVVYEIERYLSAAAAVANTSSAAVAAAAGEQALADAMTLRAAGLVGSNIEVREVPVPLGGSNAGRCADRFETTTLADADDDADEVGNDCNVISLVVKSEDLPRWTRNGHEDIVENGTAARKDEHEDIRIDSEKRDRQAPARDPRPYLSLANHLAPANQQGEAECLDSEETADPPASTSNIASPTAIQLPPLYWSEHLASDPTLRDISPAPNKKTPFTDDGGVLDREGSYFAAELLSCAASIPASVEPRIAPAECLHAGQASFGPF